MNARIKSKALKTGRLGRLGSMARAGFGTAAAVLRGSGAGLEQAVERLGELRGLGTKVGQMAGLVEANLSPEVRAAVGPALAKLRAQAMSSPYEAVARIFEEDLGAAPEALFSRFSREPFASASLGQVHDAHHTDGRRLAIKVQHPGIQQAFAHDLRNVTALGGVAAAFIMPDGQSQRFIAGVRDGFLAELDYLHEADNLRLFCGLVDGDPDLALPVLVPERSSGRILSTTYLSGVPVEEAQGYGDGTRRRQAAAIRRFLLSSLADHGVLYADAHAGNFLFREDGTVGVLDFGSVFRFDDDQRVAFAAMRDALAAADRDSFAHAVGQALGIDNPRAARAIASVQWIAIGGLVRGEPITAEHVKAITTAAGEMKKQLFREKFTLPFFMPFLMRTMLAANALLAALHAPESGALGQLVRT